MPYIQLRDRQFPIRRGQLRVGTSADADVKVPGAESAGAQAVVEMGADDHVAIKRASADAVVKVNGVLLGVEPTPLMHGDKIEIAGVELLFGDDRRAGSTQYLGGAKVAAAPANRPAPGKATAATGGRIVSLVDGREYMVRPEGVTFGRDAGCEIVIPATEVSRRHAMVIPGEGGYVLTDLSTNGVLVNGERIAKTRTLGRGDVIRIGAEEFRFYADVAPGAAAAPAAASPTERPDTPRVPVPPAAMAGVAAGSGVPRPAAESPVRAAAPASPSASSAPSVPSKAAPAASPPAAAGPAAATPAPPKPRAALASLEIINEGVLKGKRFEIRSALTHIGRGAHNDVVIADDSVSDSHAKIQKRESGWYVVDMGSTNGTYVGGRRITDEKQLVGSPDIRFGGVKMVFQVAAEAAEDAKGTRAIAGVRAQARQASAAAARATPPVSEPAEAPPAGRKISGWIWVLLLLLVAAMVYFIFEGAQ